MLCRRANPGDVERLLLDIAAQDGKPVRIGFSKDPGQAKALLSVLALARSPRSTACCTPSASTISPPPRRPSSTILIGPSARNPKFESIFLQQRDAMGRAARMAISSLTSIDGVPDCAKRAMRRATRPNAGGLAAGDMAGLARGRARRSARVQSASRTVSIRGMTCWPVSTRVGNVQNNDPSLIEPIATE
jgi:hypothetical protein